MNASKILEKEVILSWKSLENCSQISVLCCMMCTHYFDYRYYHYRCYHDNNYSFSGSRRPESEQSVGCGSQQRWSGTLQFCCSNFTGAAAATATACDVSGTASTTSSSFCSLSACPCLSRPRAGPSRLAVCSAGQCTSAVAGQLDKFPAGSADSH